MSILKVRYECRILEPGVHSRTCPVELKFDPRDPFAITLRVDAKGWRTPRTLSREMLHYVLDPNSPLGMTGDLLVKMMIVPAMPQNRLVIISDNGPKRLVISLAIPTLDRFLMSAEAQVPEGSEWGPRGIDGEISRYVIGPD